VSEFVDHLVEVFEPFAVVTIRRMFGGYGVFHEGLMFGLVAGDVLYLKSDEASAPAFAQRGLAAFEYEKQGKRVRLSYYMAPDEFFDDPGAVSIWAGRAYEAALRSRRK
jgi:DNA transformation protein